MCRNSVSEDTVRLGEQEAVDKMKEEIKARKIRCYDYMESLLRYDDASLKQAGFKTLGEALDVAMKSAKADNKVTLNRFLKQFPD